MEDSGEKIGVEKSIPEESYAQKDPRSRPRGNPTKDTTEERLLSKSESSGESESESGKKGNAKVTANDVKAPVPANPEIAETPSPKDARRRESRERSRSRTRSRTRASDASASPRRSTRSSGKKSLVDGLKEPSPSSSTKSSGSKPLRDSCGRFITKKKWRKSEGNDQITRDQPSKQALTATAVPVIGHSNQSSTEGDDSTSVAPAKAKASKRGASAPSPSSRDPKTAAATTVAQKTQAELTVEPGMRSGTAKVAPSEPTEKRTATAPPTVHSVAAKPSSQPSVPVESAPLPAAHSSAQPPTMKPAVASSVPTAVSESAATVTAAPARTPSTTAEQEPPTANATRTTAAPAATQPKVKAIQTAPASIPQSEGVEANPALGFYAPANMTRGVQQAADEAAIYAARSPLTNLYGQYICKSTDSSLEDARIRLKKAISQTRDLRQLFTERVYGKYRVCMKPPPEAEEIIARIEKDPVGQHRILKEEIAVSREEKEVEKKEAAKLNKEMAQSASGERASLLSNVDNAEQVMYLTAGLNLVILPEDQVDPKLVQAYADRGPVNQMNGQRVKSISQAAATAGEVILDRTRKAAAMRVERQRRRQLQLLRGEVVAGAEAESNYSRLQVLAAAGSSASGKAASKSAKTSTALKAAPAPVRRGPAVAAKGARSRPQTSMSANALLNLNPTADEMKIGNKPSPATIALMSRGVGPAANKTTQQRLRHPHPDSLGGLRRASANPSKQATALIPPQPFLQANLANTLPPLPSTKDRLERKRLPVQTLEEASSNRARISIQNVLKNFVGGNKEQDLRPVSKIDLLNGLRKLKSESTGEPVVHASNADGPRTAAAATAMAPPRDVAAAAAPSNQPLNPSLTLSVLHALGVIGTSRTGEDSKLFSLPNVNEENTALWSDKLKALREKIVSEETTLDGLMLRSEQQSTNEFSLRKRTCGSNSPRNEPATKIARTDHSEERTESKSTEKVPIESIRGGGEVLVDSEQSEEKAAAPAASKGDKGEASAPAVGDSEDPKKRKRSDSSPGYPAVAAATGAKRRPSDHEASSYAGHTVAPAGFLGHAQMGATMNAMHIANQLHHMHHPSAGDLAEYLGSLQQQQGYDYELPSLMAGAAQGQPNSAGMAGHTLPDRAAAATAMLFREQQAAALLGGYPPGFPPVPPHPATFSAFFGGQGPYGQARNPMPGNIANPAASATAVTDNSKKSAAAAADAPVKDSSKTVAARDVPSLSKGDGTHSSNTDASKKLPAVLGTSGQGQQGGMHFTVPPAPAGLEAERANQIRSGYFHRAVAQLDEKVSAAALKFLLLTGASVPIPKGLVLGPLKERLNTPGFKNAGSSGAPPISRDVVAAVIRVWLWSAHEQTFQQAFEKNGRIDVDPDCKWLVQAAVDTAVGELSLEIAESMARGEGAFAEAAAARKDNPAPESSKEIASKPSEKLDVFTASVVSRALTVEMHVDSNANTLIPKYQQFVEFLDESRMGALRAKSRERVLLATLIARKTMMTESFAHAYVSAMVRAGEALGHGKLFETAQDEDTMTSTMIPYDILTDDGGLWEDPCRPEGDFTDGLTGEDLMRRAHARAMIQKSLRKLQDRNHIRGGTSSYGPLVDPSNVDSHDRKPAPAPSPRPGPKRRVSSLSDLSMPPGTGSAHAKSWTVYDPNHYCSPLDWDPDILDNAPYGVHAVSSERMRSMSMSVGRGVLDNVKTKRSMSLSLSQLAPRAQPESDSKVLQSTREIDWEDVASTFQSVELPRKSSRNASSDDHHHTAPAVNGKIFAPFCRKIDRDLSTDEEESDTEEDLTDETTLARHQVVLDEMKQKLNAYLEARKKQQEARKNKYSK